MRKVKPMIKKISVTSVCLFSCSLLFGGKSEKAKLAELNAKMRGVRTSRVLKYIPVSKTPESFYSKDYEAESPTTSFRKRRKFMLERRDSLESVLSQDDHIKIDSTFQERARRYFPKKYFAASIARAVEYLHTTEAMDWCDYCALKYQTTCIEKSLNGNFIKKFRSRETLEKSFFIDKKKYSLDELISTIASTKRADARIRERMHIRQKCEVKEALKKARDYYFSAKNWGYLD